MQQEPHGGEPCVSKNLVQVVLGLGPGGTERLVIDMTRALSREASARVICLDEAGSWAPQLSEFGVDYDVLDRQPGFDWSLIFKIRRILRNIDAPVVHCHHYTPFVYGALAAIGIPGSRIVYTEHGRYDDGRPSLKRRIANAVFARLPGDFFAVSDDLRRHLVAEGFPASRMQVNHNGIDVGPRPLDDERAAARAELGLNASDTVIGTVARLHPVKDLGVLLNATWLLNESHPEFKVAIIGDGEDRETLEALAGSLGIRERIVFTGQRDDARALLAGLDIYVNCSIIEGISVTILEAMASALPVVATAVGGTPEVVTDGETGLLVPSREAQRLADALCSLLENPSLSRALADAARVSAETHFSTAKMIERYRLAYGW